MKNKKMIKLIGKLRGIHTKEQIKSYKKTIDKLDKYNGAKSIPAKNDAEQITFILEGLGKEYLIQGTKIISEPLTAGELQTLFTFYELRNGLIKAYYRNQNETELGNKHYIYGIEEFSRAKGLDYRISFIINDMCWVKFKEL